MSEADLEGVRAADHKLLVKALADVDRSAAILLASQENAAGILLTAQRESAAILARAQGRVVEELPDHLATPLQDANEVSAIGLRAAQVAAAEHLLAAQEKAAVVLLEDGRKALGVRERAQPQTGSETGLQEQGAQGILAEDSRVDLAANYRRLRLLFDHMHEGAAYCRMLYDSDGRPDDFVYIKVNPAFALLTGLTDVEGKRVTDVIPGIRESNPELLAIYGRVARAGVPEEFETEVAQLGITLRISVFQPEPDYFVAVFDNITERKRIEQELEDLNRYLEFRVEQRTADLAEALHLNERAKSADTDSNT